MAATSAGGFKANATRKELYGPSGFTPAALAAKRKQCATINPRKAACKRGHPRTPENVSKRQSGKYVRWTCLPCERDRWKRRYLQANPNAIVPAGMSLRSAATAKSWVKRREQHGDAGYSPEELERRRKFGAVYGPMASRLRTVCKRGHALKPPNILVHGGVRRCRQCYVDRKRAGRPEWITIDGVKMSVVAHDKFAMDRHAALRRAMVAAHPDKPGGTSSKFREAKRRIDRFMSDESKWYDKAGLAPPWAARSAVVTH